MKIGDRIKALRLDREWTQAQLAQTLGVAVKQIGHYENHRARPGPQRQRDLVVAFGLRDLSELYEGVE